MRIAEWVGRLGSVRRRRRVFSRIYEGNLWQGDVSVSGAGSDLVQTEAIRREIPRLVSEIGARSVLDLPCGDFLWMSRTPLDVDLYIGADIVPDLIESNRRTYGEDSRRRFEVLDLVENDLPTVDLVLCRDCLVHLSYADIARALANLRRSGSRYLLTTTFREHMDNVDIETGHWRTLNLVGPPFGFPDPLKLINEGCTVCDGDYSDKSLALWRIVDIEFSAMRQR
jgi:SAM-dependent methyltransferase